MSIIGRQIPVRGWRQSEGIAWGDRGTFAEVDIDVRTMMLVDLALASAGCSALVDIGDVVNIRGVPHHVVSSRPAVLRPPPEIERQRAFERSLAKSSLAEIAGSLLTGPDHKVCVNGRWYFLHTLDGNTCTLVPVPE